MATIHPVKDNVLIILKKKEKVTSGGIHLPEVHQKGAVIEGRVHAIGPKVTYVQPGSEIFFDKHSPTLRHVRIETAEGDVEAAIMKEVDIIGVYTDGSK